MKRLAGKRCLLIGATGFVGRALAARLIKEGAELHALARGGKRVPKAVCHAGDLDDAASVKRCLAAADPEIVFFVARLDAPPSMARSRREARWTRLFAGRRLVRAAFSAPTPALHTLDVRLHKALKAATLELFGVYGPGRGAGAYPRGGFRDYVRVDDVAEAFVRAAILPSARGKRIPVGTGVERDGKARRRVPERAAACRAALGWAPKARPL